MDNIYNFQTDNIEVKSFIDKKTIFKYITEEQIFAYILGFEPKEFDYICSPLREDRNPGAFFQRGLHSNRLLFMDYADPSKVCYDCFDFIKKYFNLPDFYSALKFVKENIIERKGFTEPIKKIEKEAPKPVKRETLLNIEARPFNATDGVFWGSFGISRENLIEDKVFAVNKIFLRNGRKGNRDIPVYTKCYAYTDFPDNRKKLYFPHKKGSKRFLSTCKRSDITTRNIDRSKSQIVISKSYKDNRVLRNYGANAIWFQNEGSVPENLEEILEGFDDIIVFFDNDLPGITAGKKIVDIINNSFGKTIARSLFLEKDLLSKGVKDPADMYAKLGKESLYHFLEQNGISK